MCGRYYITDETAREIERLVRHLDRKLKLQHSGDVYPSQKAEIFCGREGRLMVDQMDWGFPGYESKQLLINARAESVLERKTFRDSIFHRRCIIPAKGFYEWNKSKEKFAYERKDMPFLLMAGCYNRYQERDRFVILTTEANASVSPVHDRMPLILEPDEAERWILDDRETEHFLKKVPVMLKSKTEYEQIRLF